MIHGEIDDPPAWLRKEGAVSISRAAYYTRDLGAGWDLINRAILTEVSILSPGIQPAHSRARVVWISAERSPAAVPDRPVAGIAFGHGEMLPPASGVIRRYSGQVLAVR